MPNTKTARLKKSPNVHPTPVYHLSVYRDRLEFRHKGIRYATENQRLIAKALSCIAEIYLG